MRVEVGEGVGLLAKEEGLPLGAGINMSVVAGIAANVSRDRSRYADLAMLLIFKQGFQEFDPSYVCFNGKVPLHIPKLTRQKVLPLKMHKQAHRVSHIGLVESPTVIKRMPC